MANAALFSVGHSNHELRSFLRLLHDAGITAVADVRSQPFSRRLPHFNRPELERALGDADITYVFLGDQLGGRPRQPELYTPDGRADYERMRATAAFRQGLERLAAGQEEFAIAMMCSEDDPLDCHRGLMITPALGERGLFPLHLRRDGTCETTAAMEQRLLAETGIGAGLVDGLFAAMLDDDERHEFVAAAYRVMASRKAFRLQAPADDNGANLDGTY